MLVAEDEDSDGSVHSHIFSPSKAPPKTSPTPTRRKKAPAQKTPTKVAPRASPPIQEGVEEVPTPWDSERTPTASPLVDLQVFCPYSSYFAWVYSGYMI